MATFFTRNAAAVLSGLLLSATAAQAAESRIEIIAINTGAAEDTFSRNVEAGVKARLLGIVEYRTSTCELVTSGNWSVTSPPVNGSTSTGIFVGALPSGSCAGKKFPFGSLFYTWTSRDAEKKTDQLDARWQGESYAFDEHFDITLVRPEVTIESASLSDNAIAVTLKGASATVGVLSFKLEGSGAPYEFKANGGKALGPGAQTIKIPKRNDIPTGKYTKITSTWTVKDKPVSDTFPIANKGWDVTDLIRYSQYNVPDEKGCEGGATDAFLYEIDVQKINGKKINVCKFHKISLKAKFVSQTALNGTGKSIAYGILKSANATKWCDRGVPAGATKQNSFRDLGDKITGQCPTSLVSDRSLATYPGPKATDPYICGGNVLLVTKSGTNKAQRTSDDLCPACRGDFRGASGHIDAFTSKDNCSAHDMPDLGNFWTGNTHGGR